MKTTSTALIAHRFALPLVALLAAFAVTLADAPEARADDTCPGGYTCMYDGTGWGGRQYSFGDYDYSGNWRSVGTMTDKARSLWNSQNLDKCYNTTDNPYNPWVYFADTGPSGKVGALFFVKETMTGTQPWRSIGYYEDRIDARYNRCGSAVPGYIPKNAF